MSRNRSKVVSQFILKMAAVSEFALSKRGLIKQTPPKPFLIGVAGGSASGKVSVSEYRHL